MKISIDKGDEWITFISETQFDCFCLGRISKMGGCIYEITSNTDDKEEKLRMFKMKTKVILKLLQE